MSKATLNRGEMQRHGGKCCREGICRLSSQCPIRHWPGGHWSLMIAPLALPPDFFCLIITSTPQSSGAAVILPVFSSGVSKRHKPPHFILKSKS